MVVRAQALRKTLLCRSAAGCSLRARQLAWNSREAGECMQRDLCVQTSVRARLWLCAEVRHEVLGGVKVNIFETTTRPGLGRLFLGCKPM